MSVSRRSDEDEGSNNWEHPGVNRVCSQASESIPRQRLLAESIIGSQASESIPRERPLAESIIGSQASGSSTRKSPDGSESSRGRVREASRGNSNADTQGYPSSSIVLDLQEDPDEGPIATSVISSQYLEYPSNCTKMEFCSLTDFERALLFKSKYLQGLQLSGVKVSQENETEAPIMKGSGDQINAMKIKALEWFRRFVDADKLDVPEKLLDGILSCMVNEFKEEVVYIKKSSSSCISVHAVDEVLKQKVRGYYKQNFVERTIQVKEVGKYSYVKRHLKEELEQMESEKQITIKISADGSYCLKCFGSIAAVGEAERELKELVGGVLCEKVEFNSKISENMRLFVDGLMCQFKVGIEEVKVERAQTNSRKTGVLKNVCISVDQGKLEDFKADVLVHPTTQSLEFISPLSKGLQQAAGEGLSRECSGKKLSHGEVVQTKGHNLKCEFVLHTFPAKWSKDIWRYSESVLRSLVIKCLATANDKNLTSIAFPPIASGGLGMPCETSAHVIFRAIECFLLHREITCLKDIAIVVFEQDKSKNVYQTFCDKLKSLIRNPNTKWQEKEVSSLCIYSLEELEIKKVKSKIQSVHI